MEKNTEKNVIKNIDNTPDKENKGKFTRIYFEVYTAKGDDKEWRSLIKGFHEFLTERGINRIRGGSESSVPLEDRTKRTYSINFFEKDEPVAIEAIAYFQKNGIELEGRDSGKPLN